MRAAPLSECAARMHSFELVGGDGIALERQQTGGQHLRLGLGLHAEQVEHRELLRSLALMPRLRFSVWNSSWSSSRPTEWSCHAQHRLRIGGGGLGDRGRHAFSSRG